MFHAEIGREIMRDKFMRFMSGRYGSDELSRFLSIFSCVILLAAYLFRGIIGSILVLAAFACLIYSYYRTFSKKIYNRRQENAVFLKLKASFLKEFNLIRERFKNRKTHKYFKCPKCKATMRVPKGKGKILITCSRCGNQFTEKS